MKRYINAVVEIEGSEDIVRTSNGLFAAAGNADFGENRYDIDEGFWG